MDNGLTDQQITKILSKYDVKFNGVYCKNQLPDKLDKGWYVINLQSSNQGDKKGTHWVCFKYDEPFCEYFDSFGIIYPKEILQRSHGKKILWNKMQIQDYNSTACGWFCIGCVLFNDKITSQQHFYRFLSYFSSLTKVNDTILKQMLKNRGVMC